MRTDYLWELADRLWVWRQQVQSAAGHRGHVGRHRGEAADRLFFISLVLLALALVIISVFF